MKMINNKPVLSLSEKEAEVITNFSHLLDTIFSETDTTSAADTDDIIDEIAWVYTTRNNDIKGHNFIIEITDDEG